MSTRRHFPDPKTSRVRGAFPLFRTIQGVPAIIGSSATFVFDCSRNGAPRNRARSRINMAKNFCRTFRRRRNEFSHRTVMFTRLCFCICVYMCVCSYTFCITVLVYWKTRMSLNALRLTYIRLRLEIALLIALSVLAFDTYYFGLSLLNIIFLYYHITLRQNSNNSFILNSKQS